MAKDLDNVVLKWVIKGMSEEKILKRLTKDYKIRINDDIIKGVRKIIDWKVRADKHKKKQKKRKKTVADLKYMATCSSLKYR